MTVTERTTNNKQDSQLAAIANKYLTPLYIYDADTIKNRLNQLQEFCGSAVDIFYSLKANPNKAIVSLLSRNGASAEVCSSAELESVLSIGVPAKEIIFVGPYKSDEDLTKCISHGIYAIVISSVNEFVRVSQIANQLKIKARILVRINPDFNSKDALLKMGGKPSQFGIDKDIFYQELQRFSSDQQVELLGIHIYNGTRILSANTIVQNTKNILAIATDIQQQFNLRFQCVDVGGGVGVPYFSNEKAIDLKAARQDFHAVVADYLKAFPNTKIIMESGRFLVAESGWLVSRVQDIKESKWQTFLVTDGGTNCHMAAVGVGSLVKRNFPIKKLEAQAGKQSQEKLYNITGPLCTPNDLVAKQVILPACEVGDLVCVQNSGAYGPTASPVYFLSHGFPAEVMIHQGKDYLIRSRDSTAEIHAKQIDIFSQQASTLGDALCKMKSSNKSVPQLEKS
jgi:diaminopimelate decarboxylase